MTFTIPSINCCKLVRNGYAHKSSLQKVYNGRLRVVPIRSISVQCKQITARAKNQKNPIDYHSFNVGTQRRYVFIKLLYPSISLFSPSEPSLLILLISYQFSL